MAGQLVVVEELQIGEKRSQAVLVLKLSNDKLQALTLSQDDVIQSLRNQTLDFGRDFNKQNDFQISFVKNLFTESNGQQALKQISKSKDGQSVLLQFNKLLRTKYFGENIERSVLEDVAIRMKGKQIDGGELIVVELDNLMNLDKNGNKLCTLNGSAILNQVSLEQSFMGVLKEFGSLECYKSVHTSSVDQIVQEQNSKSTLNIGAASFEVNQPSQQQHQQPSQQQQQQQRRAGIIPRHNFDVAAVASDEQIAPIFQELLNMQTDLYNQDFYSLDLRLKAAMHALVVACQNRDSFDYLNDMVNVFMDEYAEQQWGQEG